ncbi:MAG TPA: hypothetical protein VJ022_00220 [Anaerolineales bacterium]|nr:hypothetical protein [Anaerolineales bacterium]
MGFQVPYRAGVLLEIEGQVLDGLDSHASVNDIAAGIKPGMPVNNRRGAAQCRIVNGEMPFDVRFIGSRCILMGLESILDNFMRAEMILVLFVEVGNQLTPFFLEVPGTFGVNTNGRKGTHYQSDQYCEDGNFPKHSSLLYLLLRLNGTAKSA